MFKSQYVHIIVTPIQRRLTFLLESSRVNILLVGIVYETSISIALNIIEIITRQSFLVALFII